MIVTLRERKAREIERKALAAATAMADLASYAVGHGGSFTLFGSFARGDFGPTSDFDVLVDFPPAFERAARDFAEATCRRAGLVPDVHLASDAADALLIRIRRDNRPVRGADA